MTLIRRNPETVARLAAEAKDAPRVAVRAARRAAFADKADPMIGQVLRGEETLENYRAVIAAIRARLPFSEEPADA